MADGVVQWDVPIALLGVQEGSLITGASLVSTLGASGRIWFVNLGGDDMNVAWNAWTGGENLPARACIEARLAQPEILVEIAVVAAKEA
jgi:hypothetical protein